MPVRPSLRAQPFSYQQTISITCAGSSAHCITFLWETAALISRGLLHLFISAADLELRLETHCKQS